MSLAIDAEAGTVADHARAGMRKDIQAMRAVAVVAVFLYHLWPRAVPGGFVGVDVFFVISGFLIAGNLIREAEATGRVRIWAFWARRARRLLPAALTVLVATSVGVYILVPQNLWPQFLRENIASALYVQNWVLAGDSVDYFAADNAASPAQHFWTLSAEEQFYIFTPLLLLALLVVVRRLRRTRRVLLAGILATTIASFACSIWLTADSAPSAYFVTTTRAWEFGVGALLVFAPRPRSVAASRVAVAAGLAGVVTSALLLSNEVPFPGAIALWPVIATAAVVWGGVKMGRRWEGVAGFAPVQLIGRISYSTYLWHWPLIVLVPYALDHGLTNLDKVAILATTFVLAASSTRFIEDPIRYSSRLPAVVRSPRGVAAWAVAGMVGVVAFSGIGLAVLESNRIASAQQTAALEAQAPRCLGAEAIVNATSCVDVIPSNVLVPFPAQASTDTTNRTDCWAGLSEPDLRVCSLGPAGASVRLAAIGDSHSNELLAAYQALAERNGWRIDVAGHNGCYWTAAVLRKPVEAMVEACEGWKARLTAYFSRVAPYDAILVTYARTGALPVVGPGVDIADATAQGLVAAWAPQIARGTRIIAIRDNPVMNNDVVACVVRFEQAANEHCGRARGQALGTRDPLAEAVLRSTDARLVDLADIYCPATDCLPVIGNVVVYQDRDHLTATFARSLTMILSDRIATALQ